MRPKICFYDFFFFFSTCAVHSGIRGCGSGMVCVDGITECD